MDYEKIVYDGFTTDREFLTDYFVTVCKKAERDEIITPDRFFAGCKDVYQSLLYRYEGGFSHPSNQGVQYDFDGNKYVYSLDNYKIIFGNRNVNFADIEYIKQSINEAKEKIVGKEATPPPAKLTTKLNQVKMKAIHQWMTENNYIDVDVDSWLFWFDLQTWISKKKKPTKIKWNKAVYHLTNVVSILCENMNKQTETAMKDAFQLPNGGEFQKKTAGNIQRDKEPYKSLYNMIEFADRNIKNL